MLNSFFFNIPISYKKIYFYSKILSNKPLIYYYYLNFLNKFNFFLKKIADKIFNILNLKKIFVNNFLICKGLFIKKIIYRAKGRINFLKKRNSKIFIKVSYGKKN